MITTGFADGANLAAAQGVSGWGVVARTTLAAFYLDDAGRCSAFLWFVWAALSSFSLGVKLLLLLVVVYATVRSVYAFAVDQSNRENNDSG